MDADFANFLDERVARGQHEWANLGRRLVLERAPHWFDRLDFEVDRPFLDPWLFAHACADRKVEELDRVLARYAGGERLAEGIELVRSEAPVLGALYGDAFREAHIAACAAWHGESVAAALAAVERLHPRFHQALARTLRRIVVFRASRMNSFAAMSCHGTAFVNAGDDDGPEFFVEELAHQGGHVVLNAVLFAGEPLLIEPQRPLRMDTGRASERRTVLEAFHGVFTEALMVECLAACRSAGLFEARELDARLAFTLRRFGSDAHILSEGRFFTPLGEWVFGNVLGAFKAAYESHAALACQLDFGNQPYKFDYGRFIEANG